MQEVKYLLDHVNKAKASAEQLTCLEVYVREEDIVMTLLKILPKSYEYSITSLVAMLMKELTI